MGTGYVRNDTSNNISDGNVINASDLDGEFDAIVAAFNASTGHSHDGTTGEGPQITSAGIADSNVTPSKLDSTATYSVGALDATGAVGAGSVNVGTSSPATYGGDVNIIGDVLGGESTVVIANSNANQFLRMGIKADVAQIAYDNADSLAFGTAADSTTAGLTTEHMRINSTGSVGIATSSPTTTSLHVQGISGYGSDLLHLENDGQTYQRVDFAGTGSVTTARIDASTANGNLILQADPTNVKAGSSLQFEVDGSEIMRADGAGLTLYGALNEAYAAVGASTVDCSTGTVFSKTLTANTTFTFSNAPSSGTAYAFTLKIVQDATARTITWPATVDWAAGTAPTLSTDSGAVDVFVFLTHDGGSTWYGFTAGQALA